MKDFLNFLSEARKTRASEKARKLGLTSDGKGNWVDRGGNVKARTQGGELVFVDGRKVARDERDTQEREVRQDTEDRVAQAAPQTDSKSGGEEEEGGDKNGETITLVFGRFNPPTVGHEKLLDSAASIAKGDLKIYPSRSFDPKKNPLDPNEKASLMKQMFPDHAENIVNDENVRSIFDALKLANEEGYSNVQIVVGSDRVSEFDSLAQRYNGELYEFDDIETISAGERDADAEGVEGMSASKMRKAASEDDFETFRQGVPETLDDKAAKQMMNTVRKAMKVTTESWSLWEIAPKFDWRTLRENYVSGKIFNINSIVENLNTGLIGKVIRRGTNYLICVTEDNMMFKSWVRDLKEYTEVKMDSKERVPGKPNTLVGTNGYFKHVADMTPGFEKGDKTNLQPGGKPYKGYDIKSFINKNKKK